MPRSVAAHDCSDYETHLKNSKTPAPVMTNLKQDEWGCEIPTPEPGALNSLTYENIFFSVETPQDGESTRMESVTSICT